MLKNGRDSEFIAKLADGIGACATVFYPRPVIYRYTDFHTSEYKGFSAVSDLEEQEESYRGASRFLREVDILRLELEAVRTVRRRYPNLWLMIPFVRTVKELTDIISFLDSEGLSQTPSFKLWIMVQVPSNVLLIEEFLDTGIDGVCVGIESPGELIHSTDRSNSKLADEFDLEDKSIMLALETVVKACLARGVATSVRIRNQRISAGLFEALASLGIRSVTVSPEMINIARRVFGKAEAFPLSLANLSIGR
jgi:pyruvate,water dikinase